MDLGLDLDLEEVEVATTNVTQPASTPPGTLTHFSHLATAKESKEGVMTNIKNYTI